jgi:hypothetical protein
VWKYIVPSERIAGKKMSFGGQQQQRLRRFRLFQPPGMSTNGGASGAHGGGPGSNGVAAVAAAANQPTGSVLLPDYSVYSGTPSHVANMRVRANVPGFIAENELKVDILKRQHICLSQVLRSHLRAQLSFLVSTFAQRDETKFPFSQL